jgi:hypothetical protein
MYVVVRRAQPKTLTWYSNAFQIWLRIHEGSHDFWSTLHYQSSNSAYCLQQRVAVPIILQKCSGMFIADIIKLQ